MHNILKDFTPVITDDLRHEAARSSPKHVRLYLDSAFDGHNNDREEFLKSALSPDIPFLAVKHLLLAETSDQFLDLVTFATRFRYGSLLIVTGFNQGPPVFAQGSVSVIECVRRWECAVRHSELSRTSVEAVVEASRRDLS